MKLLPLFHSLDTYGCLATGLPYKDSTSGTPAGGHVLLTTVQHGAARDGFMRIAGGVIPVEDGDRADGTVITDMGTLTVTADSLTQSRHAVVAMYSVA
jgi:hypothetical protein